MKCTLISIIIPWSPIARGLIAKPLGASSLRSETDGFLKVLFLDEMRDLENEIINRVEALAKKRGISMAQMATAWVAPGPKAFRVSANRRCYYANCRVKLGRANHRGCQFGIDRRREEICEEPYATYPRPIGSFVDVAVVSLRTIILDTYVNLKYIENSVQLCPAPLYPA